MKLFILEFNESYTGGGVIALYENKDEFIKNLKDEFDLVLDEKKIQLYKLSKDDSFNFDKEHN